MLNIYITYIKTVIRPGGGVMAKKTKGVPSSNSFEAPSTSLEKTLAGLFSSVLGIGRIGINDNFFNLGGNSLQAVWLLTLVRDSLGLEIPPEFVYFKPTVAH